MNWKSCLLEKHGFSVAGKYHLQQDCVLFSGNIPLSNSGVLALSICPDDEIVFIGITEKQTFLKRLENFTGAHPDPTHSKPRLRTKEHVNVQIRNALLAEHAVEALVCPDANSSLKSRLLAEIQPSPRWNR